MSDSIQPNTGADPLRDVLREALEREVLADIPITAAMQMRIIGWDGQTLQMSAPLGPNVNDKGCAFGGSLASVMTLAGWALVRLAIERAGLDCDIYVQDSTIRYLLPVWSDFVASARLHHDDSFADCFNALRSRGKGRLSVHCEIPGADGAVACVLTARFVALLRSDASPRRGDAAQSVATSTA